MKTITKICIYNRQEDVSLKFGCSLEMVNMLTSGPNFIYKQSKGFWVEFFKYVSAVGFKGIELPFNPYNSDPMAFETGRCGIPCNAVAVRSKYGSPEEFLAMLNEFGIEEVTSVHVNANDAMLEVIAAARKAEDYYGLFRDMCLQAIDHLISLKGKGLVISPTPEIGWLETMFGGDLDEEFTDKTVEILSEVVAEAEKKGVQVAFKTEYWSLFRGNKMAKLLERVSGSYLCPDLAHMQISGDPTTIVVNAHKHQVAYMRVSDTGFEDAFNNWKKINAEIPVEGPQKVFCDLGEGKVDILSAVQVLKDSNYDGWIICEQKKTLDVYRGLLKMGWFVQHKIVEKLR
jgi:inosose dehydratase